MLKALLAALGFSRCEHEYEPQFYGKVVGLEDLFAVVDECRKCGHRIARTP